MHPSEKDAENLTEAQIDTLYHLLCEMFPSKADRFQWLMNDLDTDNASAKEKFSSLLGSVYDWFHYGN